MSDLETVMSRFHSALAQTKARIDAAEARPDRQEIEAILKKREDDMQQFEALKSEISALKTSLANG